MSAVLVFITCLVVLNLSSASSNTIIRKVYTMCRDTDIDVLSSTGVKIEPYDRSLVELHFPDSFVQQTDTRKNSTRHEKQRRKLIRNRSQFRLEFSFKTRGSDGVLFYTRSKDYPTEMIAFFLKDGELNYKLTCPTLAAVDFLSPRNGQQLNDGRWHNVSFSIRFYERLDGRPANITIDGVTPYAKAYPVSCHRVTSVYVGGWRETDIQYMYKMKNIKEHFHGCIRNLKANLPLRSPPKYVAVSSCD